MATLTSTAYLITKPNQPKMNTIRIERKSPDGLTMQVWEFGDKYRNGNYTLREYCIQERETTRKRTWVTTGIFSIWKHPGHRNTPKIPFMYVPTNADLLDEVRQQIINQIKVTVQ